MEQVLLGVSEDMAVWLKERKPTSLEELGKLADDYALARKSEGARPGRSNAPGLIKEQAKKNPDNKPTSHFRSPPVESRTQVNFRGDRRCFSCGRWGHLSYTCPNQKAPGKGESKALFAEACDNVAWNEDSIKYLRRGTVDGRPVQMLVDTGSDRTIVSAGVVKRAKMDPSRKVPIQCVHGDVCSYPTAVVKLAVGPWKKETRVAVAPNLPVAVLLGRDTYECSSGGSQETVKGLAVITRSQSRRANTGDPNEDQGDPDEDQGDPDEQQGDPDEDQGNLDGQQGDLVKGVGDPLDGVGDIIESAGGSVESPNQDHDRDPEIRVDTGDEETRGKDPASITLSDMDVELLERDETGEGAVDLEFQVSALDATPEQIVAMQQADPSLKQIRDLLSGTVMEDRGSSSQFHYRDGMLYRTWKPQGAEAGGPQEYEQLVLPSQCRGAVLRLAHEVPMAGHLGVTKTKDRVLQRYYWPGVFKDVAQYCRSCEVCQRSTPRRPLRAEMIPMPLMTRPFERIAMDIVGPLPQSKSGNRFILTIVDYATRYPEAIALPSTEASRIAKELVTYFSRVGIPEEILSDQGANFMSGLLQEVYQLLHIRRIRTSPYHPQTDGLVERFNGTLKGMLRKFVGRGRSDWDDYLPYLLFAYREVPQETTGFSPFELLYGRRVRGPLDVLKESWTGEAEGREVVASQVLEMRERLQEMMGLVQINVEKAQQRQKHLYDRKASPRSLTAGEQVLVLLPNPHHSLKLEWVGPYNVLQQVSPVDYVIEMPGRRKKRRVYHINLLKKYHPPEMSFLAIGEGETELVEVDIPVWEDEGISESLYPIGEQEDPEIEKCGADLSAEQKAQLHQVMKENFSIFESRPGRTTVVEHQIRTGDAAPVRQKPYRIPYSKRELVKKELDDMLEAKVIRPSVSPWAAPIVLVPKKDGTTRFCVDYRKLNVKATFDAYPMPRVEEMFESIGAAKVITTLDLAKGYWQIPMEASSREKTAFTTPFGLYEFEVMPFGLHSAPATFQRMIDEILRDCRSFSGSYIDDIAIFSNSWEEHVQHLQEVFSRLSAANLHVKVKKCQFGHTEAHYLGHIIGQGKVEPDDKKIAAVLKYPTPTCKKDVRAFLGMVGYYRRFIDHFATIATPLTNLTKKWESDKVCWTAECEKAFVQLKQLIGSNPVLMVADPTKPYVLQTDASNFGLGAVLSQTGDDGLEHPVAYASRKLQPRETKYSTIEKECLAIVWSLKLFHVYLYGQAFSIETDHQPLSWLQKMKDSNARLTRWSLLIQPYRFELKYRKGVDNKNADGLSRSRELTVEA